MVFERSGIFKQGGFRWHFLEWLAHTQIGSKLIGVAAKLLPNFLFLKIFHKLIIFYDN
jgi:hypothetical protein